MGRVLLLATMLVLLARCSARPGVMSEAERQAVADTIRQQAAALYADENRRSAEIFVAQMSDGEFHYASSGNLFPSKDSLARAARRRVASLKELTYTLRDSYVTVLSPTAGVFSGSYDEVAVDSSGAKLVFRDAWTAVYERQDGKWNITHGHFSRAPVDNRPSR